MQTKSCCFVMTTMEESCTTFLFANKTPTATSSVLDKSIYLAELTFLTKYTYRTYRGMLEGVNHWRKAQTILISMATLPED